MTIAHGNEVNVQNGFEKFEIVLTEIHSKIVSGRNYILRSAGHMT